MKCLVCGMLHQAAECPRCHFPEIQTMGDPEQERKRLEPIIRAYRDNLLNSVQIRLPVYRWKDQGGQLAGEGCQWTLLASGTQLFQKEAWLPEKFARIPQRQTLSVPVRISVSAESRDVQANIPNLLEPELQELGATIDSDLRLHLLLRSGTREAVTSQPIDLFD